MRRQRHVAYRHFSADPIAVGFFTGHALAFGFRGHIFRQLYGYIAGTFQAFFALAVLVEPLRGRDILRRFLGGLIASCAVLRAALILIHFLFFLVLPRSVRIRLIVFRFTLT